MRTSAALRGLLQQHALAWVYNALFLVLCMQARLRPGLQALRPGKVPRAITCRRTADKVTSTQIMQKPSQNAQRILCVVGPGSMLVPTSFIGGAQISDPCQVSLREAFWFEMCIQIRHRFIDDQTFAHVCEQEYIKAAPQKNQELRFKHGLCIT